MHVTAGSPAASPGSLVLLTSSVILAALLYSVDSTIVNVALVNMQGSLQATRDQAAWIVTAYIVAAAVFTPLAGWLGSRFGLRRILLISIAGFTAGSMLCGLATSLPEIILFRVLQGALGAGLVPLSQAAILHYYPREKYARVLSLWGMAVMVGPVLGPTLGGWLTESWSWRWAFYINLPIGILAAVALMASMPQDRSDQARAFDMTGFVLVSLGLALFQLMLDRGQQQDWFQSTEIIAEAFFAALCMYMFIVHALTRPHPFVDIHLFRNNNFVMSILIQLAIGLCMFAPSVLIPNFLQQLQGHTPSQAGVLMAARGAGSVAAMLIAGRIADKVDTRAMMLAGLLVTAAAIWQMSYFSLSTPPVYILLTGLAQGLGMPLAFLPISFVAFSTLPDSSRAEGSMLMTLARSMGGSAGVTASVAYVSHSAQVNSSYIAEHFTPFAVDRWAMVGDSPGANAATALLMAEIDRQALSIAYVNNFRLLAILVLCCTPLLLLFRRSARHPTEADRVIDAH